jgi:hypothetical protein
MCNAAILPEVKGRFLQQTGERSDGGMEKEFDSESPKTFLEVIDSLLFARPEQDDRLVRIKNGMGPPSVQNFKPEIRGMILPTIARTRMEDRPARIVGWLLESKKAPLQRFLEASFWIDG